MPDSGYYELHIHLEGSITPKRLQQLADKYGHPEIPRTILDSTGTHYRPPIDFKNFLQVFKAVTSLLRSAGDYHAVALDMGNRLSHANVHYAEVIVAYGVMRKCGIDPQPVQYALSEAAAEIEGTGGPILRWLPDSTRQFGAEAAWWDLEAALKAGSETGVVGYGIGGDAASVPLQDYAAHFQAARKEGLGTTLHAGETEGPRSVREAIEIAGVSRIGHATSAVRDPTVMALLRDSGVFVELCPGSNVATGIIASLAEHPLRAFLDVGLACCLNTDDPAIFNLDLPGEYSRAVQQFGLSGEDIRTMRSQAEKAAFGTVAGKKDIPKPLI